MNPTTNALLISAVFLCGLQDAVLSQHGHCTENLCFALFQESEDFAGAQKSCKDSGGHLLALSSEHEVNVSSLLTGLSGSFWLALPGTTEEDAAGLQNCSSISASMRLNSLEPCRENLNGFLCQYPFEGHCRGLQAGGGALVKYTTTMGFEVKDSDTFPEGTIAVVQKAGGQYLDSKHVCSPSIWLRAPWTCEVMQGGCEHKCSPQTSTCICPAGQQIQPNNITCVADPCSKCAQECQREGDTHVCKCRKGFRLAEDGRSCVDVNECEEENPCTGENEECENTEGGSICVCKDGFEEEDGECVDVTICDKCEHMKCEKVKGVYECACRTGFKVSGKDPTKCEMECKVRDCPALCIPNSNKDQPNNIQCFCPNGYILDHDTTNNTAICTDMNECESEKQCDHRCENLFGGYRCLCNEGFKLHKEHECVPTEEDDEEDGSGQASPYPTPASSLPASVPPYIQTGSILGITVFMALCAALLFFLVHNALKRCGRFELSPLKNPNIDIFYLQQVTTDTYKRLSFDKQLKNDSQVEF